MTKGVDGVTKETEGYARKRLFLRTRIYPLFFLVLGAVACLIGFRHLYHASVSTGWPTTTGQVVSSVVNSKDTMSNGKHSNSYYAEIQYSFKVENQTYMGHRVSYGDSASSWSSGAQKTVACYPKGSEVMVSYQPSYPQECVLEPGMNWGVWFVPVFGIVFVAMGILMMVCPSFSK